MMLRKSIERLRNSEVAVQSPVLAEKLTCYAGILAAEGSLSTAMTYLPDNSDQVKKKLILKPLVWLFVIFRNYKLQCIWVWINQILVFVQLFPHQPGIKMLRDRLYHAQGEAAAQQQPPNSFNRVGVPTANPTPAAQPPAPKAPIMVEMA